MSDYPVCPVCARMFEAEECEDLVTYWGEDGPLPEECPCGAKFLVREWVTREYEYKVTGGNGLSEKQVAAANAFLQDRLAFIDD